MSEPDCPGCKRIVRVAPAEVDRILTDFLRQHPGEIVASDEVCAERLALCQTCPDLRFSTTCKHCGCLVDIRAKLQNKHCPAPSPRW